MKFNGQCNKLVLKITATGTLHYSSGGKLNKYRGSYLSLKHVHKATE